MGKRELLILIAFLALGALVYRISAPPATEGDEGFSLGRIVDEIRADIASDSSAARFTHEDTIEVTPNLKRIRVGGLTGEVTVTGEDRDDIAFELSVRSTGPDVPTALGYAQRTVLAKDDLGDTLGLRVSYPPEARQTTSIALYVPSRLAVTIDSGSSREFILKGLESVHLEGVIGELRAESIEGSVTGNHRSGRLTVADAGAVNMSLPNSRSTFTGIRLGLTLSLQGGECEIIESNGPIALEQTNAEISMDGHDGSIQISGSGGEILLTDPGDVVHVDVRSTRVEVMLARAIPMTIFTTSAPLRLVLEGTPGIALDASVSDGDINATDLGLEPKVGDQRSELRHVFDGDASPRVVLRNRGDDIVIRVR